MLGERFPKRYLVLLSVAGVLLLATMLCYPLEYDIATFMAGGELVMKGGMPFRDFIDVKPPLIFYIYGLASWIFGHHEWSIRAFDLFYHIASLSYLFYLLRRSGVRDLVSVLAIGLIILHNIGVGPAYSAQVESFAMLPSLFLLDCTLRLGEEGRSLKKQMLLSLGVAAATVTLVLLKYTLGLLLLPTILCLLFTKRSVREVLLQVSVIGFGVLTLLGCYVLFLYSNDLLEQFVQAVRWSMQYGKLGDKGESSSLIQGLYHSLPIELVRSLTITVSVFLIAGAYKLLTTSKEKQYWFVPEAKRGILVLLAMQSVAGLITVAIEKKFFDYHYTRATWQLTPIAAIGLIEIVSLLNVYWKQENTNRSINWMLQRLVVLAAAVTLMFYSPLIPLMNQSARWIYARVKDDPDYRLEVRPLELPRKEYSGIHAELQKLSKPGDKIFFWGTHAYMYYELNITPLAQSLLNVPFTASFTPVEWKNELARTVQAKQPKFILVEKRDTEITTFVNRNDPRDSYQLLQDQPRLWQEIQSNYSLAAESDRFNLYQRMEANRPIAYQK